MFVEGRGYKGRMPKSSGSINIMLINQSKISPTNDEEMRHARSSSNANNSNDECQ